MKFEYSEDYTVGHTALKRAHEIEKHFDGDERGLLWISEPPDPFSTYVVGVDATGGITGWNRYNRTKGDKKTDRGAIVVLKRGNGEPGDPSFRKSVQVALYAAPIDPYDLARVANAAGRLYAGRDEQNMAHLIIETNSIGATTQRELIDRFGYTNLYRRQSMDSIRPGGIDDFGWYSTKQSMQHLWTRGLRAIHKHMIVFKSRFLVEEFANSHMDMMKQRGRGNRGHHDDMVTACLLAIWDCYNWSFYVEPDVTTRAMNNSKPDWQRRSVSSSQMYEEWNEIVSNMMEGR